MDIGRPSKRSRKNETNDELANASSPHGDGDSNQPLLVFAHGAGAPSSSEWMTRWKKMLGSATGAVEVVTFDYPCFGWIALSKMWAKCADFSGGKRRAPPKAEKLVAPHIEEVKNSVAKHPKHPLVLVGKSMGSRVSCIVAGREDVEVSAVICLGYPLKGANGAIRDDTLLQVSVPVLFVQGSKDGLCPLEKLEAVRKKMKAVNELHVVEGGDHSLKVGKQALKAKGINQDEAEKQALTSIQSFLSKVLKGAK